MRGGTDEPGTASPGLKALVRQVWGRTGSSAGRADPDWPVRVTCGPAPGQGHRRVESYIVVPDLARARLLVPVGSGPAAVGFLRQNGSLRHRRIRWSREAMAAAFRTGAASHVFRDRLDVWVDERVPGADLWRYLVLRHLEAELGVPRLYMGIGVRAPDPNYKPSLQLFGDSGAGIGYAKVGWNDSTQELVANETATLRSLAAVPPDQISVPSALHAGEWAGRRLLVASPLPAALKQYRDLVRPPGPDVLRDIAGRDRRRGPLRTSSYWARTNAALDVVSSDPAHTSLGGVLRRCAAELERRFGAEEFELGRWHGDWVPWNVGVDGRTVHVWDWEHSAADVPVGFDLAHWHFQVSFVLGTASLEVTAAKVRAACSRGWPALGVTPEQGRRVATLYLLEAVLRGYRLMRGGGGWHPRMYPAALDLLQDLLERD